MILCIGCMQIADSSLHSKPNITCPLIIPSVTEFKDHFFKRLLRRTVCSPSRGYLEPTFRVCGVWSQTHLSTEKTMAFEVKLTVLRPSTSSHGGFDLCFSLTGEETLYMMYGCVSRHTIFMAAVFQARIR